MQEKNRNQYVFAVAEQPFFKPKLKTCPFCGDEARVRPVMQIGGVRAVQVQCMTCGVCTGVIAATHYMSFRGKPRTLTIQDAIDEAADIWNTREAIT